MTHTNILCWLTSPQTDNFSWVQILWNQTGSKVQTVFFFVVEVGRVEEVFFWADEVPSWVLTHYVREYRTLTSRMQLHEASHAVRHQRPRLGSDIAEVRRTLMDFAF